MTRLYSVGIDPSTAIRNGRIIVAVFAWAGATQIAFGLAVLTRGRCRMRCRRAKSNQRPAELPLSLAGVPA